MIRLGPTILILSPGIHYILQLPPFLLNASTKVKNTTRAKYKVILSVPTPIMTCPVHTRGLIEQANDGDFFSVVMDNAFFQTYLKLLFKTQRRFEFHLSRYQWYVERTKLDNQQYVSEWRLVYGRRGGINES